MNKKIKSHGIKCSQCAVSMKLYYDDDLHWKWVCPQCKAEIKGDLPNEDVIQETKQKLEQFEKTIMTVYVKLNSLSQIGQLRELIPELADVSIAEIKKTLLQNQMKWPIRNYQMAIDAMRPLADYLGLEITSV
jgi:archaellum component FlaC